MPRESTIQVYRSSTAANVPTGLTSGELAANLVDRKLFVGGTNGSTITFLDASAVVTGVNGTTGNVTNVAVTNATNNFTAVQSFPNGISSGGGATFAGNTSISTLKMLFVGGDEGGQIDFDVARSNTSLTGAVTVDIYQNKFRIFESTGTNRGAYIDLTTAAAGVGTNLLYTAPVASASITGVASFNSTYYSVSGTGVVTPTAPFQVTGDTVSVSSGSSQNLTRSGNQALIDNRIATTSLTGVAAFNSTYYSVSAAGVVTPTAPFQVTGDTVSAGAYIGLIRSGNQATVQNIGVHTFNGLTGVVSMTGDGGAVYGTTNNTIAARLATTSLTGVASFPTADFTVTAGAVNLKDVVRSVNGTTGAVTNIAVTNATNNFTAVQAFPNGISGTGLSIANGATFTSTVSVAGSLTAQSLAVSMGATFSAYCSFVGGLSGDVVARGITATTIRSGTGVFTSNVSTPTTYTDVIYNNSANGGVTIQGAALGGGVLLNGNGGGATIRDNVAPVVLDTAGGLNDIVLGDYSIQNYGFMTVSPASSTFDIGGFALNSVGSVTILSGGTVTFENLEYIRNTTNGRMDFMPSPNASTAFGMYVDMTSWTYGTALGTIRSSDGALNAGAFRFDSPITIQNDVAFNLGNSAAYKLQMSTVGNDTMQIGVPSGVAGYSAAVAIMDYAWLGYAGGTRSPSTQHANPNLYIYRTGASNAGDFMRMEHDGAVGRIATGATSGMQLEPGNGTLTISGGVSADSFVLSSNAVLTKTTAYSLTGSDNGKVILFNAAGGVTANVPAGLPIGYAVTIIQIGAGQVSLTGPAGVTLNSYGNVLKISGQNGSASLICYGSNLFNAAGTLSA